MFKRIFSKLYMSLILVFLYAPILVLVTFSFNSSRSQLRWGGFTFDWYLKILTNDQLKSAIFNTISIAFISTIIATIFGTFTAIGIYKMNRRFKSLVLNINNIPILNPDIVTGIALMILFISAGFRLGYVSMLLAHIMFSIPFVILAILPKLRQLNPNLFEAAIDLGAKPFQVITKVIIPVIKPGIITGALIAFTMSIDDFVISYFTTGNGVNNLSIWIYSQTKKGINPMANAVSTIMLLIVMALLIIINIRQSKVKEDL